jgi:hypothetical protein
MDVSDASYYIFNHIEKEIKVAKWGTPKKKYIKNIPSHLRLTLARLQLILANMDT